MPITLATLPYSTAQEVFDQVASHLLTQNAKSVARLGDGYACAYRGADGMKCAAGCLIGDDEYRPEMEGAAWCSMTKSEFQYPGSDPHEAIRGLAPRDHLNLISDLQIVHDSYDVPDWRRLLAKTARDHGLVFNHV